jgi:Fe-S-cluster containining protein
MSKDCTCSKCIEACYRTPGKFAPGEVEKAAEFLNLPFEEFKKLIIKNYWRDQDKDPLIWEPRKVGSDEDMEIADDDYTNHMGRCVFLNKDDRCDIHPVKPYECRESVLCEGNTHVWPILNELYKKNPI